MTQPIVQSPTTLQPFKTTFPSGSLVNDGGEISLIVGHYKKPFATFAAFTGLGYQLKNVILGDTSSYPLQNGYIITTANQQHPWGAWVNIGQTIYYVHETGLIPIATMDIFTNNGGKPEYIVPANTYDTATLQASPQPLLQLNDSRIYR